MIGSFGIEEPTTTQNAVIPHQTQRNSLLDPNSFQYSDSNDPLTSHNTHHKRRVFAKKTRMSDMASSSSVAYGGFFPEITSDSRNKIGAMLIYRLVMVRKQANDNATRTSSAASAFGLVMRMPIRTTAKLEVMATIA